MQFDTTIFSEEELEILRERTEKFKKIILDFGPQEIWKQLLNIHAVIDPAIQEKLIEEQRKTNEFLQKLIEEQERLSTAIENFIDKIFEAEAFIDSPSEKIIQYPSSSIFSDHTAKQNQDDHPHDQEPCL